MTAKTDNATTLKILTKARSIINKSWTKGQYARDERSRSVKPSNPKACKFCALGAIWVAAKLKNEDEFENSGMAKSATDALNTDLVELRHYNGLLSFNDSHFTSKKDVLALFDRTIKRLRAA